MVIYSLCKKTNNFSPKLKESLIDRKHKPIKILLSKKIVHNITYTILDENTITVKIHPQNNEIACKLKKLLPNQTDISHTHFKITLKTKYEKNSLKEFINSKNIIDTPHLHIYNRIKMDDFFKNRESKIKTLTYMDKAYIILGSTPKDNVKMIKKRYKQLAQKYHPDKVITNDKKTITLYTKKFQAILQAYEILLDKSA